jgi:hypothetical protein
VLPAEAADVVRVVRRPLLVLGVAALRRLVSLFDALVQRSERGAAVHACMAQVLRALAVRPEASKVRPATSRERVERITARAVRALARARARALSLALAPPRCARRRHSATEAAEVRRGRDGRRAAPPVLVQVRAILVRRRLLLEAARPRDGEIKLGVLHRFEEDIVKDVRGSESNCEHDSRKM